MSNQPKPVFLDIEAVFERVYKMLEESKVEPNFAIQSRLNFQAEEVSNDAANEITLESISSLDEDWLYSDNNSNQEDLTDGSDGEAVQEYHRNRYNNSDEMVDYDSEGSEPIDEYHIINRPSVWVSKTGVHYYAYTKREEEQFFEQFKCEMCNFSPCDQHMHQRFHEIAEQLMNTPHFICSMCYAEYSNEKQHLRFHEIARSYMELELDTLCKHRMLADSVFEI